MRSNQTRFAIAGYRGPFKDEYARDDVEGVSVPDIFARIPFINFQQSEFWTDYHKAVA